jgi:hypothetical protein
MIVTKNKSNLKSVGKLHDYLYDMQVENYELLEIYEDIDVEVDSLESEIAYNNEYAHIEQELDEVRKDIQYIIKNFKKLKRDDILDELKRIQF